MPSPFGTAWRDAYPRLDAAFGEASGFTLLPQHRPDPNGRPSTDPARPVVSFTGIFDADPAAVHPAGRSRSSHNWSDPIQSSPPRIDVAASAFGANPPRPGDHVRRASPDALFAIADVRPSDLGRLLLTLNRL